MQEFIPKRNNPIELLAPAGDMEKLIMAVEYGADAVYLAGDLFGMRARAGNFTRDELPEAVRYCHENGVKVYVTCNTIPNEQEIALLPDFLKQLEVCKVDAVIIADLGVMNACKKYAPSLAIHISTQAGIMNSDTARAFYDLGAKRVILARETKMADIARMRKMLPEDLEIEAFCHGAMCVSFSGRCTLSNYMTGRDANRGQCAQSCRWKYHLVEEKRPGEYFEITEDGGTYILNSKDMCMIDHIPEMLGAGISSIKIEGRTKSSYYVAAVTNAYRHALDAALAGEALPEEWSREVFNVSHRPYSTGFYYGDPGQYTGDACYFADSDVVAVVESCDEEGNAILFQRNRFFPRDDLELLKPGCLPIRFFPDEIRDGEDKAISSANHAQMELHMKLPVCAPKYSFVRKKKTEKPEF